VSRSPASHNAATIQLKESVMRNENVPTPTSPETPPLAPYDPPAPAPQAAAWRQAIKVIRDGSRRAAYSWTVERRDQNVERRVMSVERRDPDVERRALDVDRRGATEYSRASDLR